MPRVTARPFASRRHDRLAPRTAFASADPPALTNDTQFSSRGPSSEATRRGVASEHSWRFAAGQRCATYVDFEVPNGRSFASPDRIRSTNAYPFASLDHPGLPNRRPFASPDRIRSTNAYSFGSADPPRLPNRRPFASADHTGEANRRSFAFPNRSQLMTTQELRQNQCFQEHRAELT